ncbi:MAG: hypothetical protein Q8L47_02980 [bacterium]|nr:hypothetical protein [bacterium]
MNTVTIPRKIASNDDLIVLPRREYEELLSIKKYKEFTPTKAQKQALIRAENNFRKGKTFSYDELVKKLDFTH